jgi:hypothetical protein
MQSYFTFLTDGHLNEGRRGVQDLETKNNLENCTSQAHVITATSEFKNI